MIELEKIRFKNFLSYGDYFTEIPLAAMGPCLITGDIVDRDGEEDEELDDESPNSNGAGKSTIPNAILWGLFGRTMHSARPGTKVVNWFTGEDCVVELTMKNGDQVTRVLTREGKTELMFLRNGHEEKLTGDTLATTKMHQARLNRAFNLDWDIFCGSVFFNQYGKGWLEMPDNLRKQAMERMMRIDRFSLYADCAKERMAKLDVERAAKRKRHQDVQRNILELQRQIDDLQEELEGFEANRERRRQTAIADAKRAIEARDRVELPDLEALAAKWEIVGKVREKVRALEVEAVRKQRLLDTARDELRRKARDKQEVETKIANWERKTGKICPTCEQEVDSGHVCDRIESLKKDLAMVVATIAKINANIAALGSEVEELTSQRNSIELKLEKAVPPLTMEQAEGRHGLWRMHDGEARRALERAKQIEAEQNPHGASLERVRNKKAQAEQDAARIDGELQQLDALYPHLAYINRSYADRKKIKSYVFRNHIPFINQRLEYYLQVFNVDIGLEFTESLSINSDKWGYDFFCGGERKRADIALMLSVLDLHESIYGRQCNVLVLDEVDGRLDASGIESLVSVIRNELSQRMETVFIISHRSTLHSVFPRHIDVKRSNRFSYIGEIR